ncbi:lipopolysaccharide assembly protein LapB [Aquipseudomonas alcaligenes]|uniref:MSHA biogenesis protein MshN n=1 Tax=Aquipseudomonas alcaligenes TaxID=43263 RepID=A0A1N6NZS6_AQUAC|nr:tetratricopeptide repeat protein [Pseudomonas alcaligenes]SIP97591.1 MSHA biogenesis protein MshN [Pseudomonas alcaligenes]
MSLVNDMLRDLEERRAAPGERLALEGLQAVDEAAAARRERIERLRRGSIWFMAVMLIAVLVGMMIGRVVKGQIPWGGTRPEPTSEVAAVPVSAPRLLEVLPQHDARGLTLQLLLERSVPYQRTEESGAVSLRLPGLQLEGAAQSGRLQRNGRSLSWRVEQQGRDVQVLLVGLAGELEVRDRLEPAGERWLLWIEVPLAEVASAAEAQPAPEPLPVAAPAEAPAVEPDMPAWATAPVAPADAAPAAPPVEPASAPELKIEPYRPDALSRARQAMGAGDYRSAINELEALQKGRERDPEVMRWLARAYLADGQQQRLLNWLPNQLAQMPQDSELRLLLARAQLQAGDTQAAVATLEQHAPGLMQEPTYHALLAASYQQTGQWQQSAALYRQLIALRPAQATWQLGLAIALEQLDQPAEAARHYLQALQGAGLDGSTRRFASERAAALGGRE